MVNFVYADRSRELIVCHLETVCVASKQSVGDCHFGTIIDFAYNIFAD
jgi:hypothetical protein